MSTKPLWYQADEGQAHSAVCDVIETLRLAEDQRVEQILYALRLYGWNPETVYGFSSVAPDVDADIETRTIAPLPLNVVQQVVDTFVAQICRAHPRIVHVPIGGSYSSKRKAEARTAFLDGLWYKTRLRKQSVQVAYDASLAGMGFLKGYRSDGAIVHEVVPPEEIWVDKLEARYGTPRSLFQLRYVDRAMLMEQFPEHRDIIANASRDSILDHGVGWEVNSDQLLVREAWHLPSGPDAEDDRHVIALREGTLLDEGWTLGRFPFAVLTWLPALRGFHGTSIVDNVYGIQVQINDICEMIADNAANHGHHRVYVPTGSIVNTASDFDDNPDTIIEYSGDRPPTVVMSQVIQPDVYRFLMDLVQQAFATLGLGQMFARGQNELGSAASGAAQRIAREIQVSRQAMPGEAWDDWHLDVADLDMRLAKQLADEDPNYAVLHVQRRWGQTTAKRIRFWDAFENEEYEMRAFPTNSLPETPAGKLAMVGELEDRGYIDGDAAMDLLAIPDLDREVALRTAGIRMVEWALERIVDDGVYFAPEPHMPLQFGLRRAREVYCLAVQDEIAEDRLGMLRQFVDEIKMWLTEEGKEQAAMAAAAAPVSPPVSSPNMVAPPVGVPPPPAGGAPPTEVM